MNNNKDTHEYIYAYVHREGERALIINHMYYDNVLHELYQ